MQQCGSPAPEKAGVRHPLQILFPYVGDPRECRGEAATSDFVPLCWGSPRMQE